MSKQDFIHRGLGIGLQKLSGVVLLVRNVTGLTPWADVCCSDWFGGLPLALFTPKPPPNRRDQSRPELSEPR